MARHPSLAAARPGAGRVEAERREARDDDLRDGREEQLARVPAVAQAERGGLGRRVGAGRQVGQLVLLEVIEGDGEVGIQASAGRVIPPPGLVGDEPPAEAGVAHLVRQDAREQVAQLALRHREPLGPDQRHRHRLAQAPHRQQVARRPLARRHPLVPRDRHRRGLLEARLAPERLDHRAAEHPVLALLVREAEALLPPRHPRRVELVGEGLEHARRAVLVDHPSAPGGDRRGPERGHRGQRRTTPPGGPSQIDARLHHAHPAGIAGGDGGPHGVHVGPCVAGSPSWQQASRCGHGSPWARGCAGGAGGASM
jgi:hypothetical protein